MKRYGKVPNENIRSELGPEEMFGISGCQGAGVVAVTAFPGPRKSGKVQKQDSIPKRPDMATSVSSL